jgi:hypothetical protein
MDARTPHYLRFARTLALATTLALPACSDDGGSAVTTDDEGAPPTTVTSSPAARLDSDAVVAPALARAEAEEALPTAAAEPESDAGAEADASYAGKSSGPLPPPEMPAARV